MSRSGYSEECDGSELAMYRGVVASTIRGKRGQAFLKEMVAALDAMPVKELIADELVTADGKCCAPSGPGQAVSVHGGKRTRLMPILKEALNKKKEKPLFQVSYSKKELFALQRRAC